MLRALVTSLHTGQGVGYLKLMETRYFLEIMRHIFPPQLQDGEGAEMPLAPSSVDRGDKETKETIKKEKKELVK